MGNREDLLAGAKQCLYEKGYLRTTARDIAAASGVSLAGIGYHFGSKEALMNQALFAAIGEFGEAMESALAIDTANPGGSIERFEAIWGQVTASFATHRKLWIASFEPAIQMDHVPEIRAFFAMAAQHSRTGLAALFQGIEESAVDEKMARTLGSFYYALMTGLLTQWLIDPEHAPSGRDFADALRTIAATINPGGNPGGDRGGDRGTDPGEPVATADPADAAATEAAATESTAAASGAI